MPVSIVIGGQFGSEGKGKVALEIARRSSAPVVAIRVGGPNSGHTAYDRSGKRWVLRQLPAACIDKDADVVLPAGSYIDADVLLAEIEALDYPRRRIRISAAARLVTQEHRDWEREAGLACAIGSTGSGVGAAVMAAAAREAANFPLRSPSVADDARLAEFLEDDMPYYLRRRLGNENRAIVEGTQGFGLSLLDSGYWPKATARSTTAAGALAEAGLSPADVDDVTMVVRAFPIRVAGGSGPLVGEITWEAIAARTGRRDDLREYSSVTGALRRVGEFDPDLVRRALDVNRPTRLAMNHLDYIGQEDELTDECSAVGRFADWVKAAIGREIDWYGFSAKHVTERKRHERKQRECQVGQSGVESRRWEANCGEIPSARWQGSVRWQESFQG